MRMRLKILVLIGGLLMTGVVGGCDSKDQAEVEQSFEQVLDIYPTKDLTAFYDMEGYRDSDFDEKDKGTWILQSSMSQAEDEENPLITKGMVVSMNRNTRTAKGHYYVWKTEDFDIEKVEYPVIYDQEGFHLVEEPVNPEIKKR